MAHKQAPRLLPLGRKLIEHDIRALEQRSTPDPDHARASLGLARLIELWEDEPSESVRWLTNYLADCAGSR
jgi:hypothetical protein